jgi:hypothetical protein
MRPAKLFMYTVGAWPYLRWVSQGSAPLSESNFAIQCVKAESLNSLSCWVLDSETNTAYGVCLSSLYKKLLDSIDDIATIWPKLIENSTEGAMLVSLPDFAVALNENLSGKSGNKGLFELEADLQSSRDYVLSNSGEETPLTKSMASTLEAIRRLKEELATLVLGGKVNSGINTTVSGAVYEPIKDKPISVVVDNGTAKDRFVKAPHYQGFFKEYQWLEVQQGKPHMRQPGHFLSALHMQVDKYLDRLGRKDDETQEMRKACFYLGFMIMYAEEGEGNCVRVHKWLDSLSKKE